MAVTNLPSGLPADQFDLDKYRSMEPIDMMLAMRKDLEFKMPARGLTKHETKFGGKIWTRYTWRCEAEGCWYVCTPREESTVDEMIAHHRKPGAFGEEHCPTPPRRESLPSGKMEIEKLWAEIDDVVDAVKSNSEYRGMKADGLNGYVKGLAFSIVMKDREFYPDIKAVSREALRRWKMRNKLIPWQASPTRHTHDFKWHGGSGGWKPTGDVAPAKTAKPSARKPASKPAAQLTPQQISVVKSGFASGALSKEELAQMYGVSVAEIDRALSN